MEVVIFMPWPLHTWYKGQSSLPMNRCLAGTQNRSDGLEKRKITELVAKMASVLAKSEWYGAQIADRTTTVYTNLLQLMGLGVHLE